MAKPGRLIVVGTGMTPGQMTPDARDWIARADTVLYLAREPSTERLITTLNPGAQSLDALYGSDKPRDVTYEEMVERILTGVRRGSIVCAAFYGHAGVFVQASHEAIRRARHEGHEALMLPAVSSLDCLFADLGVDPAYGCQTFEATNLLVYRKRLDPSVGCIICQVGVLGELGGPGGNGGQDKLPILAEYLEASYGPDHQVTVYEAAGAPDAPPRVVTVSVADLPTVPVTIASTLYVPPRDRPAADYETLVRLGLGDKAELFQAKRVRAATGPTA